MNRRYLLFVLVGFVGPTVLLYSAVGISQQRKPTPPDVVQETQTARPIQIIRPEQQPTPHDQSDIFSPNNAPPSSPAFETQPDQGKVLGFDFARDPLKKQPPVEENDQEKRDLVAFMRQL